MADFAGRGALTPIDFARDTIEENYAPVWLELGTVEGELYGVFFKGANKSTVWYNVAEFENAGVEPPEDWETFLSNAETLAAAGTPAYSIGGSDGWTLTDLFENIYLRTAGPEKYDQLTAHEIPWTDQSVKDALTEMGKVLGDTDNIAGGTSGALQTDFPTSVTQVYSDPPEGGAGDRRRLRRRRHRGRDDGGAGDRLQRLQLPRHRRLRQARSWAAATWS